jgi:glucose/arabinose dehydrogenase/plastocyanin
MKRRIWLTILLALLAGCTEPTTPTPTIVPTEAVAATATEPVTEPTATGEPTAAPTEAATEAPTEAPTEAATEAATAEATAEGASGEGDIGLELVAEGFTSPVALVAPPDDSGRLFVVDQIGVIYLLDENGERQETPFLDLRDRIVELTPDFDERGTLGLAFHPQFASNGRFYVFYTAPLREGAPAEWNNTATISEFTVSADDPNSGDAASERVLLQIDKPQWNHNAGQITFGPDGYLYIPIGDGGGANDNELGHVEDWYEANQGGNGQDISDNLLGSILRIDVDNEGDGSAAYAIPADNPFAAGGAGEGQGLPEIWAYGFRNPFRIAFDPGGDNGLYVGDAGQDLWEEVDLVTAGGNYGWNVREGAHCFSTADPATSLAECPTEGALGEPLIDPIIEYQNGNAPGGIGLVVIGGAIYRGGALSELEGQYIFADWSTSFAVGDGTLFAAEPAATEGEMWPMRELRIANSENGRINAFILSFGQDADGELYVLATSSAGPTGETGRIYRIVPPGDATATIAAPEVAANEEATTLEVNDAGEAEILMESFAFVPQVASVAAGTTIVWLNQDSAPHTVTAGTRDAPSGEFDSGSLDEGATFSFTFDLPGRYDYFCAIHVGMAGAIVVNEP